MRNLQHTSIGTAHQAVPAARGFTIVELLMVIGILFVLITAVLVGLRTARRGADRADTLNTLKQITAGYIAYSNAHDGRLMPGYIDAGDLVSGGGTLDISARLRTGFTLNAGDTSSYLWRLAPYLDHDWSSFMADYRDRQLLGRLETEFSDGNGVGGDIFGQGTAGVGDFGIARIPSYGLNSIFLGGDSFHGPTDHSPWNTGRKPFVAQRASDVLNPAKVIVFGTTVAQAITLPINTSSRLGYCELRAPFVFDGSPTPALAPQWAIDTTPGSPTEGQIVFTGAGPAGVPISRLGDDRIPISHLDGSVEVESAGRLGVDMSRWNPKALSTQ